MKKGWEQFKEDLEKEIGKAKKSILSNVQNPAIEMVENNLKNKDKLTIENFNRWRKTTNLEAKEREMKNAGGKILSPIQGFEHIGYKSAYFALYIAPDDIRDFYLEKKGNDFPILYLEKFPNEYNSIMTLPKVKKGFQNILEKVGNQLEQDIKLEEGQKMSFDYGTRKEKVKLLRDVRGGSIEWGTTYLRIENISGNVTKKNGLYQVEFKFNPTMYDEFKDVPDFFNVITDKDIEFKDGKPYIMKTKGIPTKLTFSVKNVKNISEKVKNGYFKIKIYNGYVR